MRLGELTAQAHAISQRSDFGSTCQSELGKKFHCPLDVSSSLSNQNERSTLRVGARQEISLPSRRRRFSCRCRLSSSRRRRCARRFRAFARRALLIRRTLI
jgi:hypothetical protein